MKGRQSTNQDPQYSHLRNGKNCDTCLVFFLIDRTRSVPQFPHLLRIENWAGNNCQGFL